MKRGLRYGVDFITDPNKFKCRGGVKLAFDLAKEIHKDDVRKNGALWIQHPVAVASLLRNLGTPDEVVVAGLLHDTVEDHPNLISLDDIEKKFGERVRNLVDGVTKEKIMTNKMLEDFATSRKVAQESVIDFGVALIKLADRYHNLTTNYALKKERQKEFSEESLRFHVPLARSFGLWDFSNLLADEAFRYYDPKHFDDVKKEIDGDPRLREKFRRKWIENLRLLLRKMGFEGEVKVLLGGYYELSEKRRLSSMRAEVSPRGFRDMSDLISFRVIVSGKISQIYEVVAGVLGKWGDIVDYERIDNFVVKPADNGYRAFRLRIKEKAGPIELAIATDKMEEYNRKGVLALGKSESRILVFTPSRELFFMPMGARVVDLAYKLNPVLGMQMAGARVDGKLAMPEDRLVSGTQVEIIEASRVIGGPNKALLKHCLPETARLIKGQLREASRQKLITKGKRIMEKVLSELGLLTISDLGRVIEMRFLTHFGCASIEQFYFKSGYASERYLLEVPKKLMELGIAGKRYITIAVTGRDDKMGLSVVLRKVIGGYGGNIVHSIERVDLDGSFRIRILTIGIAPSKKTGIEKKLKRNKYFEEVLVV